MCILWCFSSLPLSSCDKAYVRFPQPPKQKHCLWEFESILHINLDYHFPPSAPELLLHIFFLCQSLSTVRSSCYVKNCLDHRAEPKQTGQEFLLSDKKIWRESYLRFPVLINCMLVLTKLSPQIFFQKECYLLELLHASEPFIRVSHIASHF